MEIEVGEYVRSKEGLIIKVDWVGQSIVTDKEDKITISKQDIVKHSKNIIDLIEVGDYVNGYIVEKIGEAGYGRLAYWKQFDKKWTFINETDIKSVVTKEQFKNIEYRLE